MNQSNTLYALNLYNVTCQTYTIKKYFLKSKTD